MGIENAAKHRDWHRASQRAHPLFSRPRKPVFNGDCPYFRPYFRPYFIRQIVCLAIISIALVSAMCSQAKCELSLKLISQEDTDTYGYSCNEKGSVIAESFNKSYKVTCFGEAGAKTYKYVVTNITNNVDVSIFDIKSEYMTLFHISNNGTGVFVKLGPLEKGMSGENEYNIFDENGDIIKRFIPHYDDSIMHFKCKIFIQQQAWPSISIWKRYKKP